MRANIYVNRARSKQLTNNAPRALFIEEPVARMRNVSRLIWKPHVALSDRSDHTCGVGGGESFAKLGRNPLCASFKRPPSNNLSQEFMRDSGVVRLNSQTQSLSLLEMLPCGPKL